MLISFEGKLQVLKGTCRYIYISDYQYFVSCFGHCQFTALVENKKDFL